MRHFSNLADFHEYLGWPAPEHPMISLMSLEAAEGHNSKFRRSSPPISGDFNMIKIMRIIRGDVIYGRTQYVFSHGSMKFIAPGQVIEWHEVETAPWGFGLIFHKDYIRGFDIEKRIKHSGFFSYATNEALHLSPREEEITLNIFRNMDAEYHNNPDEFSKEILLSQLDTLLKYSDRFYKRQFIDRKPMNTELSERFTALLLSYFESGKFEEHGTPSIEWIAGKLSMSPRYLSDSLRTETGKTAMEHVHLFLIDEAKSLLLTPGSTISETAYRLGFEYPQYFSRLFKKKTGMTPKDYRAQSHIQ